MNAEQLAEELEMCGLSEFYESDSILTYDKTKLNLATALLEKLEVKYKSNSRFKKPTISEIQAYCKERNNSVDPEQFFDFYECKGWMVGKNKMKDWKAAVRTWERNSNPQKAKSKLEQKMESINQMYMEQR